MDSIEVGICRVRTLAKVAPLNFTTDGSLLVKSQGGQEYV
jgi:hypothetical protein